MAEDSNFGDTLQNWILVGMSIAISVLVAGDLLKQNNKEDRAPVPRDCIECDEPECFNTAPSFSCSRCKMVFYCSKHCQSNHWQEHKPDCISVAERKAKNKYTGTPVDVIGVEDATNTEECSICLMPLAHAFVVPCCKQAFCTKCIVDYQEEKYVMSVGKYDKHSGTPCPYCRGSVPGVQERLMERAWDLVTQANSKAESKEEADRLRKLAVESLEGILPAKHSNLKAFFSYAELLVNLGEPRRAIEALDTMWEENERRMRHPTLLLFQQQQMAEARGDYAEFDRLVPVIEECAELHGLPGTRLAGHSIHSTILQKAEAYVVMKDWENAKKSYLELLRDIDVPTDATPITSRMLFMGIAQCAYELGAYDKAIDATEAALEMNRHFPGVHKFKALALMKQGEREKAIATMNRAVLYETPWDEENKTEVRRLYEELLASD